MHETMPAEVMGSSAGIRCECTGVLMEKQAVSPSGISCDPVAGTP
jgi:hypothetical protein